MHACERAGGQASRRETFGHTDGRDDERVDGYAGDRVGRRAGKRTGGRAGGREGIMIAQRVRAGGRACVRVRVCVC